MIKEVVKGSANSSICVTNYDSYLVLISKSYGTNNLFAFPNQSAIFNRQYHYVSLGKRLKHNKIYIQAISAPVGGRNLGRDYVSRGGK